MTPVTIFRLAWQAVGRNPVRTGMTILGVTWGIMAFMILMAYGDGFRRALETGMRYFGDQIVVVWNGQTSLQAGGLKAGRRLRMEKRDVDLVLEGAPLIRRASGEVFRRYKVEVDNRFATAGVRATHAVYGDLRGMYLQEGRYFTEEENRSLARVVVLGHDIRTQLFSQAPVLGREIKIKGTPFRVIGVVKKKVNISTYFQPDDRCVMIPIETMSILSNTRYLSVMVYQPVAPELEAAANRMFFEVMARRHGFHPADDKAFHLNRYSELQDMIGGITGAVDTTLLLVGGVTLAIGGIGVMNIMLLSVRSRRREVGTMMALGARRRHVMAQFLCETLLLTLAGGVSGFLLATGVAGWIGSIPFLGDFDRGASADGEGSIALLITLPAFVLSLSVLGAIGLFFGVWPARQAARLAPVEALRHE